jgi:hypothetical protein
MNWAMDCDKEIIKHIRDKRYLGAIVDVLQSKIDSIQRICETEDAMNEIVNDVRTINFLQKCKTEVKQT